ncbi:MAG: DNA invertase Pin-like site-specific DNA recombinase [Psychromonas sp.]|jgi:DNA invertase Pin-like site-specific DNA recombinase
MLRMSSDLTESERNRIIERTNECLASVKKEGKKSCRPVVINTIKIVQNAKARGLSQNKTSKARSLSIATVKQDWKAKIA